MISRLKNYMLVLIYLAPGWLFFESLKPASLSFWDQAYYSIVAQTAWTILSKVPGFIQGKPIQTITEEIQEKCGGIFPTGAAKPGHISLLALI